jgi:elongation factor G
MSGDHPLLVEVALRTASRDDAKRLTEALDRLVPEDRSLAMGKDWESGLIILRGWDEDRVAGAVARLESTLGAGLEVGAPQVAYRESLASPVELAFTHKKQAGGSGEFASVLMAFEPGEPGSAVRFVDAVKKGSVPAAFIPAVESGVRAEAESGSLIGFPITGFTAKLLDGKYHDVDSSSPAFELAGRGATREAARKAGIVLLEPVMHVEVRAPAECAAAVSRDLEARRGDIEGVTEGRSVLVIEAVAPLSMLLGYRAALRDICDGRASYVMRFHGYAPVPNGSDPDPLPVAAALRA